ncbi:hypothetical protein BKA62DRAFT_695534 [Auriculariales sp. MPI-PUGE-AT-0066]|nr:hypothetical protein BKA62DRAFT_695534 [Auriculariales sp. MPI-PUGE-AT-0066]
MELYLTSSDACNADYLDPHTLKPVLRVSSIARKSSCTGGNKTTTICSFRPPQAQAPPPSATHAPTYPHPPQPGQQVYYHQPQTSQLGPPPQFGASPYGRPQASPYGQPQASPFGPSPYGKPHGTPLAAGPAMASFPVPNHTAGYPTPQASQTSMHSSAPSSGSGSGTGTGLKVVCEIEWHSTSGNVFRWPDGQPALKESAYVDSSGFFERKRKFKARSGRSYVWRDEGILQDAENGKDQLGEFTWELKKLRDKWDLQSPTATQWAAVLNVSQAAVQDLEEIVVVLAYQQAKLKQTKEKAKVAEEVGNAIGSAAG